MIHKIPEAERAASVKTMEQSTEMPVERALGVGWNTQQDSFAFIVKPKHPVHTRRQLLSVIASLFDPFGSWDLFGESKDPSSKSLATWMVVLE